MISKFLQRHNLGPNIYFSCLLVLVLQLSGSASADDDTTKKPEALLRADLFSSYSRELLPRKDRNDIVNISSYIFLKRIQPHANFMITVLGTVFFTWTDENLNYESINPQKIESIRVKANEIWVPDITVYNTQGSPHILNHMSVCHLYPSGSITCERRFYLDMYCKMDYQDWPHDTQVCSFYIGTWIESRVHLLPGGRGKKGFTLMMSRNNRRWLVKNITVVPESRGEGMVSNYLEYVFELKRKDEGHYRTLITPAIIIGLFSLLPFWLPRDKGVMRIGVTLVALILNALFIQDMGFSILGWSGDTVPKIATFYRDEMVMNLFSALITAILRLVCQLEGKLVGFLGVVSAFLCSRPTLRVLLGINPKAGPWHPLAALLDRAAFLACLLIYLLVLNRLLPPA